MGGHRPLWGPPFSPNRHPMNVASSSCLSSSFGVPAALPHCHHQTLCRQYPSLIRHHAWDAKTSGSAMKNGLCNSMRERNKPQCSAAPGNMWTSVLPKAWGLTSVQFVRGLLYNMHMQHMHQVHNNIAHGRQMSLIHASAGSLQCMRLVSSIQPSR